MSLHSWHTCTFDVICIPSGCSDPLLAGPAHRQKLKVVDQGDQQKWLKMLYDVRIEFKFAFHALGWVFVIPMSDRRKQGANLAAQH